MQDYEFIYVCNSPSIAEQLLKEAKLCRLIYGLDMTVIILNSNAGFGAANNIATQYASSARVIIMNPDVFPHDKNWVTKHDALLDALPAAQTDLFGRAAVLRRWLADACGDVFLPRYGAEFYKKPENRDQHFAGRALRQGRAAGNAAVRAAAAGAGGKPAPLFSVARNWFEKLAGFNQDYVFGHYEDADLCLKSIAAGRLPWLHDVRFVAFGGQGLAPAARA